MNKISNQLFSILLTVFRFLKIEKYPYPYFLVAMLFYAFGLLAGLRVYQNQLHTIGSIIFSLASYSFTKINYYRMINLLPWSLGEISNQKEALLTSLFLFFLSIAAVFKMADLYRAAEQFAFIGFIMLFTMIFCRIFIPFKEVDSETVSKNDKDLGNRISDA